jgi:hypothetical protein
MDILKLLKDYPAESATGIATIFALLGWIGRNVFQLIIDHKKYNKELKTFFWKEKINAAKKASEFYLENLNFLNLIRQQFEIYESGKTEQKELFENIEKEVRFYSEKLKAFPHFEHHHINIFYEFDENRAMEINKNTFEIHQKIYDLIPVESDSLEQIDFKINKIKECSKMLKDNYSELFEIQKKYLNKVREDIGAYL